MEHLFIQEQFGHEPLESLDLDFKLAASGGAIVALSRSACRAGKGGADARSNMIVVSPTLHTLIHLDEKCTVDLAARQMMLFGVKITLRVDAGHNG